MSITRASGSPSPRASRTDDRGALSEFLRARRALASSTAAGFPSDRSRRVPGLRRDEVALLAGVSTDYYTHLEQGRERNPSPKVLTALAAALQLEDEARTHLLQFGVEPLPRAPLTERVEPDLVGLLNRLTEIPALIIGPSQDVLAANTLASALYSGFERFDNLIRMIFLDPFAKQFFDDWDWAAEVAVKNLRSSSASHPYHPRVTHLVGETSRRSTTFSRLWSRYELQPRARDTKTFHHPQVGELRLSHESMAITSAPGQTMSAYMAEQGSDSALRLRLLVKATPTRVEPCAQAQPENGEAAGSE
ncbi:helix-turn-helix domain-containing protein [Actinomycetospora termitidis]|uniref:Helix-turn-helix transcriptional regulator n=1 Tax=Actinomycetospora termitidis TaxID=3053470 RepID=A0ABT7MIR9_9PSEU|nr:helix-turn-helix transcriptional regulator [Actinomycetospora sp. Odt1-22]MDL5160520.1 helix-turn-helix transcriptional regulator [Actinomycetospora sp. Odt1-22]